MVTEDVPFGESPHFCPDWAIVNVLSGHRIDPNNLYHGESGGTCWEML